MKLVFLHGAPAAGKLTVAKALLRVVPGRLFDNHAAIDLARTLFDFGAPGFWELVHSVRYAALDTAAANGVALVVTTFCYAEPDDRPQFETFAEILRRHDGKLLPVFLHCPREEALRRVGNPDRIERGKITSAPGLSQCLALRCAFHGWLFDASGRCLETPAEPADSQLCSNISQRSYPVVENSGILWAWLGEGEPPAFPEIDCFVAPSSHTFAFKGHMACNWLQALEVGIDPAHASYLHRFFEDDDTSTAYGKQFRGASAGSDLPMTKLLREYDRPIINVEHTEYGLRLIALREIDAERTHVRVTNQLFPHGFVIPMSTEMTITQWHVPVDDENCYWYAIFTSYSTPVDKTRMREQRLALYELPDYKSRKNKTNDYGFDPQEQLTATYTGMGSDINVHDQWAVESMGRIQDRTREHLGQSDKAIVLYRRLLRQQIEAVASGEKPMLVLDDTTAKSIQGPATMDGIGPTQGWETFWMEIDVKRRRGAPWATPVPQDIAGKVHHLITAAE